MTSGAGPRREGRSVMTCVPSVHAGGANHGLRSGPAADLTSALSVKTAPRSAVCSGQHRGGAAVSPRLVRRDATRVHDQPRAFLILVQLGSVVTVAASS